MYIVLLSIVLSQTPSNQFADLLDLDGDGVIRPMEAADALQMILDYEELEALPVAGVDNLVLEYQNYYREEAEYFIEDFDENGDGILNLIELPDDLVIYIKYGRTTRARFGCSLIPIFNSYM